MQTARAGISSFAGAAGFCASWHPSVIAASRTRVTGAHYSLGSGKNIGGGLAGYKCATRGSKILVLNTTSARVMFGCQLVGALLSGASRREVDNIGGNDVARG